MQNTQNLTRSSKYRDADKTRLIPSITLEDSAPLKKPEWMRIKLSANTDNIAHIKNTIRKHGLHSVCEEASCPNLAECFNHGTATFMILGDMCTRRCGFCDVVDGCDL